MRHCRLLLVLCLVTSCSAVSAAAAGDSERHYDLDYHARFVPEAGHVEARLVVEQSSHRLRELDLNAPESRYSDFAGDGEIQRDGDRLIWQVPENGGELRYEALVDHRRSGAYDARLTDEWAIVRLDDLFPPASARSHGKPHARARLFLSGPEGWSFETPYGPVEQNGVRVKTRGRRLDRPLGWMVAGNLGIRRTQIGDYRIAIAGPKDQEFRRMDMLTFLQWTLPEVIRVAPSLPERVLIVGGTQDMWRGGLSGPGSLYVHPDRPLVSGNSTSTLIHELLHVAMQEPPEEDADWIAEGLAEYYSLEILRRTGGISDERFEQSLAGLQAWVREEDGELSDPSSGADTARAVLLFRELDLELQQGGGSLDPVAAELLAGEVSPERLASLVEDELGARSAVLAQVLDDAGAPPREGSSGDGEPGPGAVGEGHQ